MAASALLESALRPRSGDTRVLRRGRVDASAPSGARARPVGSRTDAARPAAAVRGLRARPGVVPRGGRGGFASRLGGGLVRDDRVHHCAAGRVPAGIGSRAHLRRRPAHGHGRRDRAERDRSLRQGRVRGHRSLAMGEWHTALLVDRRRDAHRHRRLPPHVLSGGRRRDHRHLVLVGSSRYRLQRLRGQRPLRAREPRGCDRRRSPSVATAALRVSPLLVALARRRVGVPRRRPTARSTSSSSWPRSRLRPSQASGWRRRR